MWSSIKVRRRGFVNLSQWHAYGTKCKADVGVQSEHGKIWREQREEINLNVRFLALTGRVLLVKKERMLGLRCPQHPKSPLRRYLALSYLDL